MSQIGWTDPDTGEHLTFEDALLIARTHGSWAGLTYELLAGMHESITKERPAEVTVTTLLHCARKVHLEHEAEFFTDPYRNYPAFRGTIIHALMEGFKDPEAITEQRYSREFDGTLISGGIDWWRWFGDRALIRDFKSVNELPKYNSAYTSHIQQVNLYRWLLDLDPGMTDIEIVYISMDGVKIIPLKAGGTTKTGRKVAQQMWDDAKVEEFIRSRLALYRSAPLPYRLVPDEDLWMCAEYCEVKNLCYRKAYQEQARSTAPEGRVPPRDRKKTW